MTLCPLFLTVQNCFQIRVKYTVKLCIAYSVVKICTFSIIELRLVMSFTALKRRKLALSAGGEVHDQNQWYYRCVVIEYKTTRSQFVFSARRWWTHATSYICQLQQQGLFKYDNRPIQSSFTEFKLLIALFMYH